MMRSLYSGVAGLKTHQTKMDVIGNNIANVNTVGFKSSTVTFSDVLYQTTQSASGANEATGIAGTNAKQVGLGSKVNSITTLTSTGGTQTTDNALDCMINGDSYFIVNYGGANYFTKAGSFFVDSAGTLCTAAGAKVQGWQVDETGTDIVRDSVSNLNVMSAQNRSTPPEATTNCYITGNIDSSDSQLDPVDGAGASIAVNFYDALGNSYTAKFTVKAQPGDTEGTVTPGVYSVELADIWNSDGKSALKDLQAVEATKEITFAGVTYTIEPAEAATEGPDGTEAEVTYRLVHDGSATLTFNTATGAFESIIGAEGGEEGAVNKSVSLMVGTKGAAGNPFSEVDINFSTITQYASSGKSSLESQRGELNRKGVGAGRPMGEMTGLSIDTSGKIYGSYDNGTTKLLGQIAVTTFANATGLEAIGNSMFAETSNSGEFDGIGQDITESGGSLTTGALEMSNVDLAAEFTNMITTQRGFQANSRIITTSDTMLEELINLKR